MSKTIVMIHGMWGGAWCWDRYRKFFEQNGYSCITSTLRFHDIEPDSAPDSGLGTTSLLDYCRDLEEEIRNLDEKPILMGHSMGGLLTQILGSRDIAQSLVLIAPASPSGINAMTPSVIRSFWSILRKWGFWKRANRLTFNEAVYSMFHLLPPVQQKAAYDKFVYESGCAASEIGLWFLDKKRAASVDESYITCPVLVISGSEDRITPASIVRKIADKYRRVSTYKEFPDHAHWLIAEPGWEDITAYILEWLETTPGYALHSE